MQDEESDIPADLGTPKSAMGSERSTISAFSTGGRQGPRAVPPRDKDQNASQLAVCLTEVIEEFLASTEKRFLHHADGVRIVTLEGLESQRANVESVIGMFAQRLQQQQVEIALLRDELGEVRGRLDRYAEVIRSLRDVQANHAAQFQQFLDVIRALALPVTSSGMSKETSID